MGVALEEDALDMAATEGLKLVEQEPQLVVEFGEAIGDLSTSLSIA
ncbi:MAG: hypothetical protein R2706_13035 [Acidimicrobiales bacterium]